MWPASGAGGAVLVAVAIPHVERCEYVYPRLAVCRRHNPAAWPPSAPSGACRRLGGSLSDTASLAVKMTSEGPFGPSLSRY
jgi:hypothetical protein